MLCDVVLFPGRGIHCLRSCRVSALSMLRERVLLLSRELSIYTQTRGVEEEEGCILRIPSWYTRAKVRMHFYKPAQANLLVTLFDPHLNVTLRYAHNKKKSYNSSIIIIYTLCNQRKGISVKEILWIR